MLTPVLDELARYAKAGQAARRRLALLALSCLIAALLALPLTPVRAQETAAEPPATEPPTSPMLRVETGMHTAPVTWLAADAAQR